jgi:hypothetical protein
MQNTGDTLDVKKGFTVNSSVTSAGELTAGMIRLHGGFAQTGGVVTTYQPSGTHITRFEGVTGQTATFTNPALINSRFQNLELADSVNFTTGMAVQGTATILAGGKVTSAQSATLAGALIDPTNTGWRYQTTVLTSGFGATLPDSLVTNLILQTGLNLPQRTKVTGNFTISASGTFDLNGHLLGVGGSLTQAGILRMQHAGDTLDVTGSVTVNSGTTSAGELTAGLLIIRNGNFAQSGDTKSFHPSGSHLVRFAGTAPQTLAALRNTAMNLHRLDGATNIAEACRTTALTPNRRLDLLNPHIPSSQAC